MLQLWELGIRASFLYENKPRLALIIMKNSPAGPDLLYWNYLMT